MSQRKAFTLIELLVVIAVIAVLAAMLFPVFVSVKERGKQACCVSNMRQIGMAWQMYLMSYNDQFIQPCDPWGSSPNFVINKYSGSRKPANWNDKNKGNFFVCPAAPYLHTIKGDKKAYIDYFGLAPVWGLTPTSDKGILCYKFGPVTR